VDGRLRSLRLVRRGRKRRPREGQEGRPPPRQALDALPSAAL